MHRKRRPTALAVGFAALALVGAACSGSDDPELETGAEPGPTTGEVLTEGEPAPSEEPAGEPATETPAPDEPATDEAETGPTPTPNPELSDAAFTERSKVTTVGIDEVFFGMAVDVAAGAASTEWVGAPTPLTSCYFVEPANGPDGISFMVWNGFVERLDVNTELLTTRSGAGVGSTEQELRDLFGSNLQVDEATGDLQFVPSDEADAEFRIVFEVGDDGVVTSFRAGRVGQVELDGCPDG